MVEHPFLVSAPILHVQGCQVGIPIALCTCVSNMGKSFYLISNMADVFIYLKYMLNCLEIVINCTCNVCSCVFCHFCFPPNLKFHEANILFRVFNANMVPLMCWKLSSLTSLCMAYPVRLVTRSHTF